MSEAQVVLLACPSGAPLAGQSSTGSAGDMPGDTAAGVGDALQSCSTMGHRHGMSPDWVRTLLGLYQVTAGFSRGMEECLKNTWETKWQRGCQITSFSYLKTPKKSIMEAVSKLDLLCRLN